MAKKARHALSVSLTERALREIAGIKEYSLDQFGRKVAEEYLDKLEAAILRIAKQPELLLEVPSFHQSLRFYRVEKHFLVCETGVPGRIIILTVLHGSMDIPARLLELEPNLALEAELLLAQLRQSGGRE